jgi:hypothetical protein
MQIFIISLKHSVIRKESYSKLTNCYILTKRWFLSIEWIKHFIRASNRNTMSFCHGSLFYYNENKLFKLLESRFIFWVNYCSAFNIVQFLTWNLESTFIKFCNGFNLSSNHMVFSYVEWPHTYYWFYLAASHFKGEPHLMKYRVSIFLFRDACSNDFSNFIWTYMDPFIL